MTLNASTRSADAAAKGKAVVVKAESTSARKSARRSTRRRDRGVEVAATESGMMKLKRTTSVVMTHTVSANSAAKGEEVVNVMSARGGAKRR